VEICHSLLQLDPDRNVESLDAEKKHLPRPLASTLESSKNAIMPWRWAPLSGRR
jgi:hypothetical protein